MKKTCNKQPNALRHTLLFLGVALLLSPLYATGQELPPPVPRYWQSETTGRLYWNKHLPVYLFLSASPTGENPVKLESQSTPQYANPYYFDTEGINYMRTKWAVDTVTKRPIYPQREVLWEVYADGIAPRTRIHFQGANQLPGEKPILGKGCTLELSAEDAISGVEKTYIAIGGQQYTEYTSPQTLLQEGHSQVLYCSEDHVGNREEVREQAFTVDLSAPTTSHTIEGVYLPYSQTVAPTTRVQLTADDPLSPIAKTLWKLDSGAWHTYSKQSQISFSKLPDGWHNLYYYSQDVVRNQEEPQLLQFYLDRTPPITISDVLGDKFVIGDRTYFSGRTKMKIIAVDNHAGVKEIRYSLDGNPYQVYTEPFYMPTKAGEHTVHYYSVDSTENRTLTEMNRRYYEYKIVMEKIYVDLTGPTLSYKLDGLSYTRNDTTFVSEGTRIILEGKDAESGLQRITYTLTKDEFEKPYDGPFDLKGIPSGEHTIKFYGYDNVGNLNVKSFTLILDSDAPATDFRMSVDPYPERKTADGEPIFPLDAKIYLTAQDNMTGVQTLEYSLNGRAMAKYNGPFGGLSKGSNRLLVKATDMVGNTREARYTIQVR